jgi:hypothetical protein
MRTTTNAVDLELYDQKAAAKILKQSERTLERWRVQGTGPAFRKIGKKALYSPSDLRDFIDRQRRTSTSDSGARVA